MFCLRYVTRQLPRCGSAGTRDRASTMPAMTARESRELRCRPGTAVPTRRHRCHGCAGACAGHELVARSARGRVEPSADLLRKRCARRESRLPAERRLPSCRMTPRMTVLDNTTTTSRRSILWREIYSSCCLAPGLDGGGGVEPVRRIVAQAALRPGAGQCPVAGVMCQWNVWKMRKWARLVSLSMAQ